MADYLTSQISTIVNDAVKDALGKSNSITNINTSSFVSLGKALEDYDLLDGWFGALSRRIAKTVYFVRSYQPRTRSILRDEHEYGAFVQKVYYDMPNAVDDPTWGIPNSSGTYAQASPYDVETTVTVNAKSLVARVLGLSRLYVHFSRLRTHLFLLQRWLHLLTVSTL